jgi:hypothetical protein
MCKLAERLNFAFYSGDVNYSFKALLSLIIPIPAELQTHQVVMLYIYIYAFPNLSLKICG